MKELTVYDCLDFPAEEFGGENEVKRYVQTDCVASDDG